MKFITKNTRLGLVCLALCAVILSGCQEGDGDADYGFPVVYIPQAAVTGLNNHYPVPWGSGENTYNFKVDTLANGTPDKLQVILGVSRAGKISGAGGFVVNVNVLSEMTNDAVAELEDEDEDALPMPSGMYSLPGKASVEAGKISSQYYLTVDVEKLIDGSYDGKKLVLAIGISDPTNGFELSVEADTSVVVVIDVEEMRPFLIL